MKRKLLVLRTLLACLLVSSAASAERLRSPWESVKPAQTNSPFLCPAPPAFRRVLALEGYYTDRQYSVIDPKKLAAFNEASSGPTHLGQAAAAAADAWLSKGSRAAAVCVYSLLTAAAEADAWDGKMPNNSGVYLQNWMLSGTAVAYLKVRNSGIGAPGQDAAIQSWLGLVAARVREYFDIQLLRPGSDGWNNHLYWAGLAVGAQGVADNDADAFLWGIAAYRMGLDAIANDGSLPAEIARGQKALHYQLYALGPLVLLAEFGEANGIPMYAMKDGAVHRLAHFDIAAMQDPSTLASRAGAIQDTAKPYKGLEIGWAVPYSQRFPDRQLSSWIAQAPWTGFWQWGGLPPSAPVAATPQAAGDEAFQKDLRSRVEKSLDARFPRNQAQSSAFFGEWCTEGNSAWRSSISATGSFIFVRNESGDSSVGQGVGTNEIVAPGWDSVHGRLTPDRSQILWSNGTFWARCPGTPASPR